MIPRPSIGDDPARVLIVDDEPHNRQLLEVMLAPEGLLLESAATGEEALAIVARRPTDLVLLDIMMPGMDGYQVAAAIKGDAATRNIPVIVVSALTDRDARLRGLRAGAEEFLTKPVDRLELCVRVRNLLRLKAYGAYYDKYSQMLEVAVESRTADLAERTKQSAILAEQAALLDLVQDAIIVRDVSGGILFWSRGAEELYGWRSPDVLGRNAHDLLRTEFHGLRDSIEATLLRQGRWEGEASQSKRDGTRVVVASRSALQCGADGVPLRILTIHNDITARKHAEAELLRTATDQIRAKDELAQTDALTELANRRSFLDHLQYAFAAIQRGGGPFSVLSFDLDRFKDINDTMGHAAGDALLREIALRVRAAIRETDLFARFGGDEFAILNTQATTPGASGDLAAKVVRSVAAPLRVDSTDIRITASVGIASYEADLNGPDDLMRRADSALYRAKADGGNCFRFHSADLDEEVRKRATVAEELRVAVCRGELELHYQPQVELASRRVIGLEALIRWNHPTRGMLLPGAFIEIAEATGAISDLGRWAFEDACRQRRAWQDQGLAPGVVSVNVSGAQFRRGTHVEEDVSAILAKWAVAAETMELELTEPALMEATERHGASLSRLRRLGIRIAIDDFGTGYSSLSYLTRHPVSRLKIAQKLLSRASTDPWSATIVRAAVRIGRELCIAVIAEGVETETQANVLLAIGCEQAQGYLFGRPASAADTTARLAHWGEWGAAPPFSPTQSAPTLSAA